MDSRLQRLAHNGAVFAEKASAFRRRLDEAGLSPRDLATREGLDRLPVLKKDQLLADQAATPPFGDQLACDIEDIGHVFASPGPIFEPLISTDLSGNGMQRMFEVAGVGKGDLALNTWSYHLVPAGLLFDMGLRACGAAVIPSGPGNTDLQIQILRQLKPTLFLGSTAYFETIVGRMRSLGLQLPGDWSIRQAFLGGEFGDWAGKRQRLEDDLQLRIWSCYGTADLGLVGYEEAGRPGYTIHEDRLVQICDPATGEPLGEGLSGEIVVSTLAVGWPMVRFGTGDVSHALELDGSGFARRIALLEGRTGKGVKVREIFVYPRHADLVMQKIPAIEGLRIRISKASGRDVVVLEVKGREIRSFEDEIMNEFQSVARLRADRVSCVERFTHEEALVDERVYDGAHG